MFKSKIVISGFLVKLSRFYVLVGGLFVKFFMKNLTRRSRDDGHNESSRPPNAADATATNRSSHGLSTRRGEGVPAATPNKKPRDYHEARGSGAGPSRACCRKQLMNSRSSTAMPSNDAASSGAPDDASSAESESDTDTVDTAARAGGRGAGAEARGARGRRAGSSIVANDSTAGSRA